MIIHIFVFLGQCFTFFYIFRASPSFPRLSMLLRTWTNIRRKGREKSKEPRGTLRYFLFFVCQNSDFDIIRTLQSDVSS